MSTSGVPQAEASVSDQAARAVTNASQTIALTGASGFIGAHLAKALLASGYQIKGLTRSGTLGVEAIVPVHGDLNDAQALAELVSGADYTIHCAGAVRGASPQDFDSVNVDGLINLTTAIREHSPNCRLIHFSSLAAREAQLSDYANSKAKAERYLQDHCSDLNWTTLRPPAVYGPGDKEVLPLFRAMARGILPSISPAQARISLIYVEDLVKLLLALLCSWPGKEILEPDDGRSGGYSFADIAQAGEHALDRRVRLVQIPIWLIQPAAIANRSLARIIGYRPMLTPGKLAEIRNPDWVCDNSGLDRVSEWRPEVTLEQGIRLTMHSSRR